MQLADVVLVALLAPIAAASDAWERVSPDLALAFPSDHGAHLDYRTEWWYLTGNVAADDGRRFGYQFTIFRRGLAPGPPAPGQSPLRARQVFAGHLAITDVAGGRTLFAERARRAGSPLASASDSDLDLVLDDWSLRRGADDRLALAAGDVARGVRVELELVPAKPLVLHGSGGYSSKGAEPGNASAYTSWTRLSTAGRLWIDGRELDVRGASWFDHEFGTSVLEQGVAGWDWFGLQLDDGRELMVFQLRRADGTRAPASAGTLVAADGSTRVLGAADFRIASRASWTSPRSGATYPSGWTLSLASEGLELELVPLVADCELGTKTTNVAYWEGPVDVRGAVAGRGYAELTGYAGSMEGQF